MKAQSRDVIIVGAGLAGLTAACALQKLGFRPLILEQAAALSEVGAGITVSPNAAKALIWLGLGPSLEAQADEPPHNDVRDHATNERLVRIDRGDTRTRYSAPYWMMHRADLHALLVQKVLETDPSAIVLNTTVRNVAQFPGGWALTNDQGEAYRAALVIGADGLHSVLRSQVEGPQAPQFSGHVAWRCLVPADQVSKDIAAPGSITWSAPQRSATLYPVRKGKLINCVALSRSAKETAESWGLSAGLDAVLDAFSGFPDEVLAAFSAGAASGLKTWGLYTRRQTQHLIASNLALIGDAAHPMLPFMGQGAAMALEDGVVLARCLAHYSDVASALQAYQGARLERVQFVQAESNAGGERVQAAKTDDLKLKPLRDENALDIFAYDPTTAQI